MDLPHQSQLHSSLCQPQGKLTQVEVRGLRWDGEGRGLGKHLTTNCGCRTDRAALHLLKGFTVAVHVSLENKAFYTNEHVNVQKVKWEDQYNLHIFTSLGRPPGFIAMAFTNSGETQRTGERTDTSGPSSKLFWYWPSLVGVVWQGRVAGSLRDTVCGAETTRTSTVNTKKVCPRANASPSTG